MPYKKRDQPDFPYKKARLVNCGGDLSKRWYVVYYAWSLEEQKLIRKRIYVNEFKTARERSDEAKKIIAEINAELIGGAVIDNAPKFELPTELASEQKEEEDLANATLLAGLTYAVELKVNESDRKATKDTYNSVLSIFSTWLTKAGLAEIPLTEVNSKHLHKFFDYLRKEHKTKKDKKVSNGTFNNYKQHLTTFFNVIKDREIIAKNPVHGIKSLTVQESRNVAFTTEQKAELKEAIAATNPQLWIFAQVIYYTLMRPDELQHLRVQDVDFTNDQFYIPAEISKTKIARYPKITPPLRKVLEGMHLENYRPDHLLFTNDGTPGPVGKERGENHFTRHHRRILDGLGYGSEYVLYSWKHTGAVDLYRAGVKEQYIMRQGGWRDVKVFQKYLRSLGLYENEELLIKAPEL